MSQGGRPNRRATGLHQVAGAAALLLACAGPGPVASAAPPVAPVAPVAPVRCSAGGLHFSYRSGGVTFSVRVLSLKARGVKCASARSLVGVVARDLLHNRAVPARIAGLAVAVRMPCAGCTPTYAGTALGAGRRVAFVIMGGA